MVDQEQLTLIIAEEIPESQGFFDDLLPASHGQRGLFGEILHGGSVPVNRCVIEIRPELVDRVLAIGSHEELAAQTDNGLMGFTVPVMGVALAIEVDQADVVFLGPEDVIREISVAVIRGGFGYLGCAD